MDFIKIKKDGEISVDDSERDESPLVERFVTLVEKWGFDRLKVSSGINPSPDFGYFELADRFWRASLCIYFVGTTRGFWEDGVGYVEPWLFNARHSIELYLKGFLLYAFWFEELQNNHLSSGRKRQVDNLRSKINNPHNIYELYMDYENEFKNLIGRWNSEKLSDAPEVDKMLLSTEGKKILKEIDETDKTSFRFRYPSLKVEKADQLQELSWRHDESQLLPITGLPKRAGYFFDHVKVINSLHTLIKEMKLIASYHEAVLNSIDNLQNIELDIMEEFYSE
ncbi:MAG: hypothetical protein AB1488_00840 [Nitrospirota bacterium]